MTGHYNEDEGTLGVLGGMGPLATIFFLEVVVNKTPAEKDQDHIRTIVMNDATVPDRSAAILGEGVSPVPKLRENALQLEQMGADLLVSPCNSFHYFYEDVVDAVSIEFTHMIQATVEALQAREIERVGLLATEGTIKSNIYHEPLSRAGLSVVTPPDLDEVMESIYRIKRGETEGPRDQLESAYRGLIRSGAEVVVAGCTEIPLVLEAGPDIVDPMEITAEQCVRRMKSRGG